MPSHVPNGNYYVDVLPKDNMVRYLIIDDAVNILDSFSSLAISIKPRTEPSLLEAIALHRFPPPLGISQNLYAF